MNPLARVRDVGSRLVSNTHLKKYAEFTWVAVKGKQ